MSTHRIDPINDPRWDELMRGPAGNLFGSPLWITALAETYGFEIVADILTDEGGRPVAGLASAEIDDIRGPRILSLPFSDYLDPVVANGDEWEQLVAPLLDRNVAVQIRVRDRAEEVAHPAFAPVDELAWHMTDLTPDPDAILASFHPQARQNMRSALRKGATVTFGCELEDVHLFHAFHRATRKRKYGMLAQPLSFVENIWKAFRPDDGIVVGTVMYEGEPIAASLYLIWNGVMYYKFGASSAERLTVRPNELLGCESTRLGAERGCHTYDWGVSDLDQPGLVGYKQKFATEERRVTVLRHLPADCVNPYDSDAGRLLGNMTALFAREDVPDEVTQRAGELCYRYFA